MPVSISLRRSQARILPDRLILPSGVSTDGWHDVCPGRRRDDDRDGMVLLDFGDRRLHLPLHGLEFRDSPVCLRPAMARVAKVMAVAASIAAAVVAVGSWSLDR